MTTLFAKVYSYCLGIIILLPLAANAQGVANQDWYVNGETEFTIRTVDELMGLAQLVNNGTDMSGKTIKLGNDIVFNDTADWKTWTDTKKPSRTWATAIGSSEARSFKGTFDGGGHIISGVYISFYDNYVGLFGYNEGTIKNLGLVAFYIRCERNYGYAGGLAGRNEGTISNSYVRGTVTGVYNAGGLAGYNSYGTIINSYSASTVTGSGDYVGGLVGFGFGSGNIIINSYYNKTINTQTTSNSKDYGVGKTTAEMYEKKFADTLSFFAAILSTNDWVYNSGNKYPTMKGNVSDKIQEYLNGKGTETEPYIIETEAHLKNLSLFTNFGRRFDGEYIKLNNDIPLSDKWIAIGASSSYPFNGIFEGGGHVISGVHIDTASDYQGLFGYVGEGTIKNLGLADFNIKGKNYVGSLAGYKYAGTIINSYATGTMVEGENYVGGLVGYNGYGIIINNYSAGEVKGTGNDVGGFAGFNGGIINNGYYDKDVSKQNGGHGVSKTTDEMKSPEFVDILNKGSVVLSMNDWVYKTGNYPALSGEPTESFDINNYFASGNGTEANPYIIKTKKQLENLSFLVNQGQSFSEQYFKLGNDIKLNDTTNWQEWDTNPAGIYAWTKIGTYPDNPFKGTFDGGGYAVSGIYINTPSQRHGLFGYIVDGTIKNLGVLASYIKSTSAGGIVAYTSNGTIINSYSTGNVDGGSWHGGGLVGVHEGGGVISRCHTTGKVNGSTEVGGLAGISNGTISDSYTLGDVTANSWYAGGLVGLFTGTAISNSYALGNVFANGSDIGGLVGLSTGIINKCHATGDVTGSNYVGGLIGENRGEIYDSYAMGNIKGNDYIGGLVGMSPGTISNSYATGSAEGRVYTGGLVGLNSGGTISNSYAAKGTILGSSHTGGLTGSNHGTINDSYATGDVAGIVGGSGDYVGGLAGSNYSNIRDSYAKGNVKGSNNVGGLAGFSPSSISNSYATGNVSGGDGVGGLVGQGPGKISNSYAEGKVEGSGNYVGGLVGQNSGDTIINSYATGDVTGEKSYVGGLAGEANYTSNSYATGDVTGGGEGVGGLIGKLNYNLSNSYSTGKVKGKSKVGGLVGEKPYSTVTYSYYDIETSGQIDINKGEPRSTSQMKHKSTFIRWDFDEIWSIDKDINKGYPFLKFSVSSSSADGGSSSSIGESSSSSEATTKSTQPPNTILLSNLPPNTKIEVYNLQGKRIYSAYPENPQILAIVVQTKGVYIVKIKNQFFTIVPR